MKANETKPTNPYTNFLRLVYRLRRAQKNYFEHHTSGNLKAAKQLEAQVDKWLEQTGFEAEKIRQMGLELETSKTGE